MQRFYQARDELEAQLLIDYLGASHIQATMLGRYQSGAAGELSALAYPWVYLVEARDRQRASELLQEFKRQQAGGHAGESWRCAECGTEVDGQFDLCWQCGAGRPLGNL
jgi:hypothetical protein